MAVLPIVNTLLLHQSTMDSWTDCSVFSMG